MTEETKKRAKRATWIACVTGLMAIASAGGYGLFKQGAYREEARQQTTDYAAHAANEVKQACIRLPAPKKAQCIENERPEYELTTRDNRREHEDLIAQRKSALWTSIMGLAALIGMALSAVGVVLIYWTFKATREQGEDFNRSVGHAADSAAANARSATAMEGVAESMAINAQQVVRSVDITAEIGKQQRVLGRLQMRAYLHVEVGGGFYQEREKGIKFGARPLVANSGNTPAERVRFGIKAAILPLPLPPDFVLETPPLSDSEGMIPQNQSRVFTAFVDDFVTDDEVQAIMWGAGPNGLFVWGSLVYCDAFGEEHSTDFCQHLFFEDNEKGGFTVDGFHTPGRNKAT